MGITLIRHIIMSLDYFSAFILMLILICCILEKNKTLLLELYIGMAASCTTSILLEAVSLMASFAAFTQSGALRMVLNTASIIFGYGLAFFYACYVVNLVGAERKVCRLAIRFLQIAGLISVGLLIAGNLSGVFFTIENGGAVISPNRFFIWIFAFDILACLVGIALIIAYRNSLSKRDVVALMSLPTFIFLAATLQYAVLEMMYGLFMMAAMSLFIIYLMIQTDRNKRTLEQEKQLTEMNVTMMLSQIQPHFLYNALSSIRRMITKDPQVAVEAVESFSLYLRQNLESMTRVEPILFEAELQHVNEYLYLEKLRFGDRLRVEYDIAYSDFTLPPLTLQPIVENAVKHGILRKEEGGRIHIATQRDGASVVLTVTDDGVGFDPGNMPASGRQHIGLVNVENRIKIQCGGTLQIESRIGQGTAVTMTIPLM